MQSTSELVAQLSENLPQYMTIDLSEHEQKVKREQGLTSQAQNEAVIFVPSFLAHKAAKV